MKTRNLAGTIRGQILAALGLVLLTGLTVRANYQTTVLGDHPLAYYSLNPASDPSGTSPDLTGNGNDGASYNLYPVPGPTAYITNAAAFDGQDAAVDLSGGGNPALLNFGGPITMEAWVQPTNTTQSPADIFGKGYDSAQNDDELVLRESSGNYYGGTYNNVNGGGSASGGPLTTNWAYVVATYDGTNWNMYINGQLAGKGSDTVGAINFSDPWRIGTGSADGTSRYFSGNISQVALYNYGLTPAQVLTHYFAGEANALPSNSAPVIVSQPESQSAYFGGSATFSVSTLSVYAVTNQWYKNGAPLAGQTNSTLTITGVSSASAANYTVVVGNIKGTTTSTPAALSLLATGNSLEWTANGNSGVWDTGSSANWLNLSNNQTTVFNANDQVLFNDLRGAPANITITGNVAPSTITVNSSTNNYTFGGSGSITGAGSLLKEGASTLTIVSPANFTGPVTISGGTIYAGDYSFTSVSSVTITNNATLDFGGSTYNNNQLINVSGAGVGGAGAIYNSYNDTPPQVLDIVLTGDATFGGSARWDLDGGSINGPHNLTVNWPNSGSYGEWNSVVLAANLGNIELATGKLGIKNMGTNFGNPAATFTVDSGTELDFWTGDAGYAKNFHVLSGGLMQILAGFTSFSGNLILENGAQFNAFYGSGNQTMNGTVTLNGLAHFVLGDANFIFTNVFSGPGGFVWDAYNHELSLQASNTFTGPTVIGSGLTLGLGGNGSISHSSLIFFGGGTSGNVSLDVSGRPDDTLNLASGQTLGGIGTINGKLVVSAGAILAPGGTNVSLGNTEGSSSTGALAATGTIALNGTTVIKLNGPGTNDAVQSSAGITYGGVLSLANISGTPLTAGSSFQIFSATSYGGAFASVSPATPGAGLAWDLSHLNTGLVNVVASSSTPPVITSTTVSGGNLIFGGTGGVDNGSYVVYATTNLLTALSAWTPVATNSFSPSGTFSVTNAINPGLPQRFYLIR